MPTVNNLERVHLWSPTIHGGFTVGISTLAGLMQDGIQEMFQPGSDSFRDGATPSMEEGPNGYWELKLDLDDFEAKPKAKGNGNGNGKEKKARSAPMPEATAQQKAEEERQKMYEANVGPGTGGEGEILSQNYPSRTPARSAAHARPQTADERRKEQERQEADARMSSEEREAKEQKETEAKEDEEANRIKVWQFPPGIVEVQGSYIQIEGDGSYSLGTRDDPTAFADSASGGEEGTIGKAKDAFGSPDEPQAMYLYHSGSEGAKVKGKIWAWGRVHSASGQNGV